MESQGVRTVAHRSLGHRPGSTAKERPLAPAQVSPSSFGAAEHDPCRRLAALVTRAPWHRQESALGSPASRLFPAFLFSSVHRCIKQGSEQGTARSGSSGGSQDTGQFIRASSPQTRLTVNPCALDPSLKPSLTPGVGHELNCPGKLRR